MLQHKKSGPSQMRTAHMPSLHISAHLISLFFVMAAIDLARTSSWCFSLSFFWLNYRVNLIISLLFLFLTWNTMFHRRNWDLNWIHAYFQIYYFLLSTFVLLLNLVRSNDTFGMFSLLFRVFINLQQRFIHFFIWMLRNKITKPKYNNLIAKQEYYFHWNQLQNTYKKVSSFNFSIYFFSNGLCHLDLVIFFLRQQQTKTAWRYTFFRRRQIAP